MISLLKVIRDEDDLNSVAKKIDRMEHCLSGWYRWVLSHMDSDDRRHWNRHFTSFSRGLSRGRAYGISSYARLVFSDEGHLEIQTRSKPHTPWCEFQAGGQLNLHEIRAVITGMGACVESLQAVCPALTVELARWHEEADALRRVFDTS